MKLLTIAASAGLLVGLVSAASAGNKATIVQQGVFNHAYMSQYGQTSNKATTVQFGVYNRASTSQFGHSNEAGIGQLGYSNSGSIHQYMP